MVLNLEYIRDDLSMVNAQSWTKYLTKSKEIKQNWTRSQSFHICFAKVLAVSAKTVCSFNPLSYCFQETINSDK